MDIDEVISGHIDDRGSIVFAEQQSASNYDLVDEIAARVINRRPCHRRSEGRHTAWRVARCHFALSGVRCFASRHRPATWGR